MNTSGSIGQEIEEFYDLLENRIAAVAKHYGGNLPTACNILQSRNLPGTKGVYFFFEKGEHRASDGTRRVVRVGSHHGDSSTIESRIVDEHAIDWGRSVFRRHVGTALIRKGAQANILSPADREQNAKLWYSSVNGFAVHTNPKHLHPPLHALHTLVTQVICDMEIVWVELPEKTARCELEKQCIRLLSNCSRPNDPIDPPSENWLGRFALKEKIRESGLWNIQNVRRTHSSGFLKLFSKYFET